MGVAMPAVATGTGYASLKPVVWKHWQDRTILQVWSHRHVQGTLWTRTVNSGVESRYTKHTRCRVKIYHIHQVQSQNIPHTPGAAGHAVSCKHGNWAADQLRKVKLCVQPPLLSAQIPSYCTLQPTVLATCGQTVYRPMISTKKWNIWHTYIHIYTAWNKKNKCDYKLALLQPGGQSIKVCNVEQTSSSNLLTLKSVTDRRTRSWCVHLPQTDALWDARQPPMNCQKQTCFQNGGCIFVYQEEKERNTSWKQLRVCLQLWQVWGEYTPRNKLRFSAIGMWWHQQQQRKSVWDPNHCNFRTEPRRATMALHLIRFLDYSIVSN